MLAISGLMYSVRLSPLRVPYFPSFIQAWIISVSFHTDDRIPRLSRTTGILSGCYK